MLAAHLMSENIVSNEEYIAQKVSEILAVLDGTAFYAVKIILDDVYAECQKTIIDLKPLINQKPKLRT